MDTALATLATARGERVGDALATLQARLQEQRAPLSRGQLDTVLKGVAAKFMPRALGSPHVAQSCLATLRVLKDVPGSDVAAAWREVLPDTVASLTVESLRESATALLRGLVVSLDRFDTVGEALIVYGLSSALSSQRAAAASCIPSVLVPNSADSVDYRRLLDALASKLHDSSASVIEACLKALGHLRNVDPSFDRQVKKLRYAHQQHITEHAEAIRHYAARSDTSVADNAGEGASQQRVGGSQRSARSLSISGVQISGHSAVGGGGSFHGGSGDGGGHTTARGSHHAPPHGAGNGSGAGSGSGTTAGSGRHGGSSRAAAAAGDGSGVSLSVHGAQSFQNQRQVRRTVSDLRRRSVGDMQFGFVPASVLSELNSDRFETKLRAADDLCLLVQSADAGDLKSSLAAFIRIPGLLVAERQYKLVAAGLTIVEILCDRCGSRIRLHMEHVVPGITHQLGATQVVLRKAAMRTFAKLMAAVGSTALLPALLRATEHPRNAYIRESGCRLIILALLTNSSVRRFDFDPPSLVRSVAALLHDSSERVRVCVMELLALLAQRPPRNAAALDVVALLRPVGLDPHSALAADLRSRLANTSLALPSINADGLVVLPDHATRPDVPETPAGALRGGLDGGAGDGRVTSSRSSRRGIPFDMPKRVGSSRALTSSRMSHRRPSVDQHTNPPPDTSNGMALHIGEDDHKSFETYKAALGLGVNRSMNESETDESDTEGSMRIHARRGPAAGSAGSGGSGSGSGGNPRSARERRPQGRGLSHVHAHPLVDSPTGKSWLHDDASNRSSRDGSADGGSSRNGAGSERFSSERHSAAGFGSGSVSGGSHRTQQSQYSSVNGSGAGGGGGAQHSARGDLAPESVAPVTYKPTRREAFERRPVVPANGQSPPRGRGLSGRPRAQTDISVEVQRSNEVGTAASDMHDTRSPLLLERQGSHGSAVGGSHGNGNGNGGGGGSSRGGIQPPFSPMGQHRRHIHLNGHGRPRRDDTRKPPRGPGEFGFGSGSGASSGGSGNSLLTPTEPHADFTDIMDSDDSDDKEVAGVVTGDGAAASSPAGSTRTLPRTFSQAITKADKEAGGGDAVTTGTGTLKVAFGSDRGVGGDGSAPTQSQSQPSAVQSAAAAAAASRNARQQLRANSKRNLVLNTYNSDSSDDEGRVVSEPLGSARGTGEAAPKKHLMTLLNRRRMNSRNASRGPTPKNRRAASASSRVEGQSQTPHHSRFEGYGYGDVDATTRLARGAASAMDHTNGESPPRVLTNKVSRTPDPSRTTTRYWKQPGEGDGEGDEEDAGAWPRPPQFGSDKALQPPIQSQTPRDLRAEDRPLRPMRNADEVYGSAEGVAKSDPHPLSNFDMDAHVQPKVVSRGRQVSKATQALRERRALRQQGADVVAVSPCHKRNGFDNPTGSDRSPARAQHSAGPRKPRATSAAARKLHAGDRTPTAEEARAKSALGFASPSPGQPSGSEYIDTSDLTPLPNPAKSARTVVSGLRSGEWQTQFSAINVVRALAIKHPDKFDAQLTKAIVHALTPLARSLRSGVAKNALLGFTDLFNGVPRWIERHVDAVVPELVKKSADKLRILADAAFQALGAMTDQCNDRACLGALLACTAKGQNNDVRNKAGKHLARLLCRMPGATISSSPLLSSIVTATARQLSEGSEEPRTAAKHILHHLNKEGVLTDALLSRCLARADADKVKTTLARGMKLDPRFLLATSAASRSSSRASSRASNFGRRRRDPDTSFGALSADTSDTESVGAGGGSDSSASQQQQQQQQQRGGTRGRGYGRVRRRVGSGPPISATASSDSPQGRDFARIVADMNSSDWKARDQALRDMAKFTEASNGFALIKANEIADNLYKRLSDGNSKVQATAVQAAITVIPNLNKALETSIPQIVPPIAALMAAKQARLVRDASKAMNLIVDTMDARCLAPVLCSQVVHGNPRSQAVLLKKLAEIIPDIGGKSTTLFNRNVIPAMFAVLSSSTYGKRDVKQSTNQLIRTVAAKVGSDHVLSASIKAKLSKIEEEQLRKVLGVM